MAFDDVVASTVLGKCARCCCLCRRQSLVQVQVHHIVPESQGGSDEEDNAIALCINCHTDVHTRAPFTRRFTKFELIAHRDTVYRLVNEGILPLQAAETRLQIHYVESSSDATIERGLSPLAVNILLSAASAGGRILFIESMGGAQLQAGNLIENCSFGRRCAEVKSAISELVAGKLITHITGEAWELTLDGYQYADAVASVQSNPA